MNILNLTQHNASQEQIQAGVIEPKDKKLVQDLLTFSGIPGAADMDRRGYSLARIAIESGCKTAMIGGAPFFMAPLERQLVANGIQPVYAFSVRESVDTVLENGAIVKKAVFKHLGFYSAEEGF